MDDPAEAPIAAYEPIVKANTIPPSTHDNIDDICADQGRTDEVHGRTVSQTSESNAIQTPAIKRFCTFIVDTGLASSPGLPPELRLEVYRAAFPEMDRPIVDEKPQDIHDPERVFIGIFARCQRNCGEVFVCRGCQLCYRTHWNNRLREAFTSNFARDPITRVEFLTEYLRRVRFYKEIEAHTDLTKANLYLWRFLSILTTLGLVGEMKHLTIETDPNAMRSNRPRVDGAYWEIPIGHVFAVLFRFRIKCNLYFVEGLQVYKPILDRLVEIVQTNLSRDEIDKYFTSSCFDQYHRKYFRDTTTLFSEDEVLLDLIDRFDNMPGEQKSELSFTDHLLMKYAIDFSK